MKRTFLITLLLIPILGIAQQFEWVNTFVGDGYDHCNAVRFDGDGNLVVVGAFGGTIGLESGLDSLIYVSNGASDFYVAKFTPSGSLIWAKHIGNGNSEAAYDLLIMSNGDILVLGRFHGAVDMDPGPDLDLLMNGGPIFLLRLDSDGNYIWAKEFTGEARIGRMEQDDAGNIYCGGVFKDIMDVDPSPTGTFSIESAGRWSPVVIKLDSSCNFIWARHFGGYSSGHNIDVYDFQLSVDAEPIVVGRTYYPMDLDPGPNTESVTPDSYDGFVTKLDSAGDFVWGGLFSGPGIDWCTTATTDTNGNVYLAGRFSEEIDLDLGPSQHILSDTASVGSFIAKYSPTGSLIWVYTATTGLAVSHMDLSATQEHLVTSGFIIGTVDFNPDSAAFLLTSNCGWDGYVSKLDTNGTFMWAKKFTTLEEAQHCHNVVASMAIDEYDNIYTTGYFELETDFDPGPNTVLGIPVTGMEGFLHKVGNCSGIAYSYVEDTICYFTAPGNLNPWSESGLYQYATTNAAGCDSIVTLRMSAFNNTGETEEIACGSFTSPSGNYLWTDNGTYVDTITNSHGCDSILTIDLTVLQTSDTALTATACGSYTSPGGNYVWTNSGTHVEIVQNAVGCDSVISVDLTVVPMDNSISMDFASHTLSSNLSTATTYQWLNCDNGNQPIIGETEQSFTPSASGNYAVALDSEGCLDTSDCFGMLGIGITENLVNGGFQIYPNPTNGLLRFEISPNYNGLYVVFYDAAGRLVLNQPFSNEMDVSNLDEGTYLISVQTETAVLQKTLIKE